MTTPHRTLATLLVVVSLVGAYALGAASRLLTSAPTAPTAPTKAPVSVAKRPAAGTARIGLAYGNLLPWMSDAERAAALDDAVSVGAGWIRADLSWADIQPDDPTAYHWEVFDRVVAAAAARSLQILPVIGYSPGWSRPGCDSDKCPPADPQRFAGFVAAATARYAPRGIHSWEVWNEPNVPTFWAPRPDPVAYARLLDAAATAVHTADRSATVISGGLAAVPGPHPDGRVGTLRFLAEVCAAGGLRSVTVVGYHPYTYPFLLSANDSWSTAGNRVADRPASLATVLRQCGRGPLPIWLTEYGAPTGGPGRTSDGSGHTSGPGASVHPRPDHVTEARQAQIAGDAVRAVTGNAGVPALFWYSDRDLGHSDDTNENHFGLRRADGTPKPAWTAFRNAITAAG